jgi:hypothetical protein
MEPGCRSVHAQRIPADEWNAVKSMMFKPALTLSQQRKYGPNSPQGAPKLTLEGVRGIGHGAPMSPVGVASSHGAGVARFGSIARRWARKEALAAITFLVFAPDIGLTISASHFWRLGFGLDGMARDCPMMLSLGPGMDQRSAHFPEPYHINRGVIPFPGRRSDGGLPSRRTYD